MTQVDYTLYFDFLAKNVMTPFYEKRFEKLNELKLDTVLKKKNPYLFKAKNIETAGEFVKSALDAFLSSQEETMFGDLLERFAIFVSGHLHGGFKSSLPSVDLEFQRDNVYYIVGIKSGIAWGNSDQVNRMRDNFKAAKLKLRQNPQNPKEIVAVNGCIYGKDYSPLKNSADPDKTYYKYAGQHFWEFISGDSDLYKEIIKPIDDQSKQKSEAFKKAYNGKINEMTKDFVEKFITDNQIDWTKMIEFVSKKK